ncbi:hypothetical protein Bca52824_092938 [Brassica carinata]|uniref:Uncharacterized protein n=1 Tax=Brassica carinata TaxID=52824 RepID=A0A8X7P6Q6_BRACI|nr:hypothetical protein Bca52824_092938 [Brassica carinata]
METEKNLVLPPKIKFTEHKTNTTRTVPGFNNQHNQQPRIIRISVTDPDATDSSSDDEEHHHQRFASKRRRIKKFVNELVLDSGATTVIVKEEPSTTTVSETFSDFSAPLFADDDLFDFRSSLHFVGATS